jgi:hypothetical protein
MPFDPRIAQQVQNLLAARVPLADAYRIAGVSQADRVYYGLNSQGAVIPSAVPPPAQIQVNNIQAEITATQGRIAALRQVVDDPNARRTARAAAQVNITRQETALADYRRELTAAQAQVAQQTVVPTAVRAAPAAQPTPAPEPPATSLIPPGYRGVVTNADGEVIGYTLPGGEIEWVPGSEPVEEYEPQDQPDPLADPTADIGPPTAQPEPQPDPFGGNGPAFDDDGNLQPGWELVDGEPVFVGFEGLTYGPEAQDDPFGGNGPAFDDDGNLQPGWELVDGEPVFVGFEGLTYGPEAQDDPFGGNGPAFDDDGNLQPGWELVDGEPVFVGFDQPTYAPAAVPPNLAGPVGTAYDDEGNLNPGWTLDEDGNPVFVGGDFVEPATAESAAASREWALAQSGKLQATSAQRAGQNTAYDWRVKISLAPGANYLYAARETSILSPLNATQGVIFPYTPTISTSYVAQYDQTDLTHSNYRGYFYRNSRVEQVTVNGTFTAQNTAEANYLLAVIHFFRSVTKMFYGQDKERGTPPPIVYLTGYGEFQFQRHPCLVSNFSYNLPNGVDYIRTQSVNLNNRLDRQSAADKGATLGQLLGGLGLQPQLDRINTLTNLLTGKKLGTNTGGQSDLAINVVNNTTQSTYVPTKMEIQVSLLPLQSRKQISQEFSLRDFASGSLLKKGFW